MEESLFMQAQAMKRIIFKTVITVAGLYVVLCVMLYFFQEKLIFFPQKLDQNYRFNFSGKFEELYIKTTDDKRINGLLFKAQNSKGLIFYLHGNAGSLSSWGEVAKTYTNLNYDVFILDYRGYGKSEGKINGQDQLFEDNQCAYNELMTRYSEDKTIVLGYSIGTGPASKLASANHPKLLILQAPYYNLTDLMKRTYPFVPAFLLKYKFETNEYLKDCKMPVVIFHGNKDEVIYYGSSLKLRNEFKEQDTLITLDEQWHNGMTDNEDYIIALEELLGK